MKKKFIDLDLLRPGDIVVSAWPTKTSYAIRIATRSFDASHAAIVINSLIWFETTRELGARYQFISPKIVWDGSRVRIGLAIKKGEKFAVRRTIENSFDTERDISLHTFARSLIDISARYAFLNYAEPSKFLGLLRFSLGAKALKRFLEDKLDQKVSSEYAGHFCSWLVADIYHKLNKPLFLKPTSSITPKILRKTRSLKDVKCTFVGEEISLGAPLKLFMRQMQVAVESGAYLMRSLNEGAELAKASAQFNDHMRRLSEMAKRLSMHSDPDQSKIRLDEIERDLLEMFNQNRSDIIKSLTIAYINCSAIMSCVGQLNGCFRGCVNPLGKIAPKYCADGGCTEVMGCLVQSHAQISAVFPAYTPARFT